MSEFPALATAFGALGDVASELNAREARIIGLTADLSTSRADTEAAMSDADRLRAELAELKAQQVTPGVRPWDMPSTETMRKGPMVLAHWFAPFPISMDNKDPKDDYYTTGWLNVNGESGKFAAYGGRLRDRPIGRAPIDGDWQAADMATEIRNARDAGIDGFALEILNYTGGNWDRVKLLVETAEKADPGFRFVLTPDMNVDVFKTITDDKLVSVLMSLTHVNGKLRQSFNYNGKVVLNPYMTKNRTPAFWTSVKAKFRTLTGTDLILWASFLNWRNESAPYAPVSEGFMHWGEANLTRNADVISHVQDAHVQGKAWMQFIHGFDHRPVAQYYDESRGTEVLRRQLQALIDGHAEAAQFVTWNDYQETPHGPSEGHGFGILDIASYWLIKYKTGAFPEIKRDGIYLVHRHQFANAKPQYVSPKPMSVRAGTNPAEDVIEVLTFLTAPAKVAVKAGSKSYFFDAPAGFASNTVPLQVGTVAASAERNSKTVAQVASPYEVLASPPVQDMQYHIASSLRAS